MDLIRKFLPHFRTKYMLKEHDYLKTASVAEINQSNDTIDDSNKEAQCLENNTADIENLCSDDVPIVVPSNEFRNIEFTINEKEETKNVENTENETISNILGVGNSGDVIDDNIKLNNVTDSQSDDSIAILSLVSNKDINDANNSREHDKNNCFNNENVSQIEVHSLNTDLILNTTKMNDDSPNTIIQHDIAIIQQNNVLNTEISKQNEEIVATNNNKDITAQTVQGIIDFEEVLKSFHLTPFTNGEIINLDESLEILQVENDIFDNVNKENCNIDANICSNDIDLKGKERAIEIDIISISSTEEKDLSIDPIAMNDSQDSNDDGYNSSDFEFITEDEAKKDGFIINIDLKNAKIDYINNSNDSGISNNSNDGLYKGNLDVEAGPSGYNNNDLINEPFLDRAYRENHVVLIGDEYLNLFQGIYNQMSVTEICFWENKSIHASPMNWRYDGMGFDKQLAVLKHDTDSSEDEFADEAKENAEKILSMYSIENRKRRRRF